LAWTSGLKVPLLTIGRSCPLKTILLGDLVGCDSPLQIAMAYWHIIIFSRVLSHLTQKDKIQTKRAPNCHYYLQMAVTPKWKDSIALWYHIRAFFSRVEIPSNDINSHSFLMNKKGLNKSYSYVLQAQISICTVIINGLGGRPVSLLPKLYSELYKCGNYSWFCWDIGCSSPEDNAALRHIFSVDSQT
jgi:hypothetical protein